MPPESPNWPARERFWPKVIYTYSCWLWTGAKNRDGYGSFGYGGRAKTMLAHRFMYQEFVGEVPEGMCVLHRCDEPACVNPDHLWLGTQADNVADCAAKGRRNQSRDKKLDAAKRAEIRQMYATGLYTLAELGRRFGVTYQTIRWTVR